MPRYRITIEYDGGPFIGWQRQKTGPSVQAAIEEAIFALSQEEVRLRGAGRTDAGVHALGQVAHFDMEKDLPDDTVREALNAHLRPAPIAVVAAGRAAADFDARFSAVKRHYLYRIVNRRAPLTLDAGRAWQVPVPLDADAMHRAAQSLAGRHDFTTFRAAECQAKSPVKTLDRIAVRRAGEEIEISVSARSFLHSQVRSMAGSLKLVGEGKWRERDVASALAAADRSRCGPLAPPGGLYLVRVEYGSG